LKKKQAPSVNGAFLIKKNAARWDISPFASSSSIKAGSSPSRLQTKIFMTTIVNQRTSGIKQINPTIDLQCKFFNTKK